MSLAALFHRARNTCSHDTLVRVCVWNLDFSDFGAEMWDGAYTDFCPKCRKFAAEFKHGLKDAEGNVRYPDGRIFVHAVDGSEWNDAKYRTRWMPVERFRVDGLSRVA